MRDTATTGRVTGTLTRRRVTGLAASGASLALLAACSGSGGSAGESQPKASTAPITITFGTDWTSGVRGTIMKSVLELFAQKHPHITLNRHDIGEDYFTRVAADFAADTQDDVTLFDGPQFDFYRKLGKFVDLTPLIKAAKIDTNNYTKADSVYTPDGKRYALPFQLTLGCWFVNKTLFQQEGLAPPTEAWTWNEWADAARKLTKPDKNQYGLGPALNVNLQVSVLPLMISNGGHHISADLKQTSLTTPQSLETLRWVADRVTRDRSWVAPGVAGVNFANGNVAMAWGNTGAIGNSTGGNVQSLADKFEWDVMPQPKAPGGKSVTTFNEQPYVITTKVSGGAARVDAGFTVLTHLASKDAQAFIARQRGSTPVVRELVRTSPYSDAPPASMNLVVKSLDTLSDIRFFAGYLEWRDAYATDLMDVWTGKVSVDAGAQRANATGEAILTKLGRK